MIKYPLKQYKYLTFLSMLFVAIFFVCDTTAFRMVDFFGYDAPLSGFIIPLIFALGDIIAETYGYRVTMTVLSSGIICQLVYGVMMFFVLKAPSPLNNQLNINYDLAFQHILRTSFTSCASVTSGMFVNAVFISKLKIYMNGRRFWLRTLLSSSVSEMVLCTVAYFALFTGLKKLDAIIQIIFIVWLYKIFISLLINPLVAYLGQLLKKVEQSDVYDINVNYNPFAKSNDAVQVFDGRFHRETIHATVRDHS